MFLQRKMCLYLKKWFLRKVVGLHFFSEKGKVYSKVKVNKIDLPNYVLEEKQIRHRMRNLLLALLLDLNIMDCWKLQHGKQR